MKKRIVALFLVVVMVLSMCACSNNPADKTTEADKTTQGKDETEKQTENGQTDASTEEAKSKYPLVDEPVRLKGIVAYNANGGGDSRLIYEKVGDLTGIYIDWQVVDVQAIPTILASGDWPDVLFCNPSSNQIQDYGVLGGRFVDFMQYLDLMPNLVQAMEDYPAMKLSIQSNGAMYRLPFVSMLATSVQARSYVNTDVLAAAGVKTPTTVDEFEQSLKDLQAYYGTESVYIPRLNHYNNNWSMMLFAAFGELTNMMIDTDKDGKLVFSHTSDQMKHYYEFMNKLYEQGLIHKEVATLDTATKNALELSGKIAFLDHAGASIPANDKGEFPVSALAPFTSQYDSTRVVEGVTGVSFTNSIFVNSECEYVEELCQWLDIAYATEEVVEGSGLLGQSFMHGIEGENFKLNDDGKTYTFIVPEGYASGSAYTSNAIQWYNFGRADYLGSRTEDKPSNSQARQKAFVENVMPYQESPLDTFVGYAALPLTEDQQYVIDSYWEEMQTYWQKMQVEFITGVTDIETGWDTYVATLKRMGLDEVMKVYQDAYDAYLAKK